MKFYWSIDKNREEEITALLHRRTGLIDELESLVRKYEGLDRIVGYREDEWRELRVSEIECVAVIEGRTYVIDGRGERYRVKEKLYELEACLPSCFIRVNKSALANERKIEKFTVLFNGAVDVVFQCGYREYVSRRCFREIKRRLGNK